MVAIGIGGGTHLGGGGGRLKGCGLGADALHGVKGGDGRPFAKAGPLVHIIILLFCFLYRY